MFDATTSISTQQLDAAVAELEARLALDANNLALRFDRAQIFELLGRKDDALAGYVSVLAVQPENAEALNAVGLLIMSTGNREAARTFLSGAVLHGPTFAAAHANLGYVYLLDGNTSGARALYARALDLDPTLAIAHHGMAELLERLGDDGGAAEHRSLGLRYRPITISRYLGAAEPVRALVLGSALLGNIPTQGYLDNHVFLVASLTVEHMHAGLPLPPHDVVFNVIGEADLCGAALARAAEIISRTSAPVINHPAAVAATSRAANAHRLNLLAGVVAPKIVLMPRALLQGPPGAQRLAAHGLRFPLLVRSPGFHTGDHFVKVDDAAELDAAVASLPGDELFAIEYFDLRDGRGDARKYRAIVVDGELYPLHVAISQRWKVHYFSADMAERAEHRAEDAAFLADMPAILGRPVMAALERIRDVLALDYGGIDFTVDGAGNVLVFEANASMIVPLPDRDPMWDYRRAPVARIHAAVQTMLVARAERFHL